VAIPETEQWPTAGADGLEEALPPDEKAAFLSYTSTSLRIDILNSAREDPFGDVLPG
jgi:hypothetical protein